MPNHEGAKIPSAKNRGREIARPELEYSAPLAVVIGELWTKLREDGCTCITSTHHQFWASNHFQTTAINKYDKWKWFIKQESTRSDVGVWARQVTYDFDAVLAVPWPISVLVAVSAGTRKTQQTRRRSKNKETESESANGRLPPKSSPKSRFLPGKDSFPAALRTFVPQSGLLELAISALH